MPEALVPDGETAGSSVEAAGERCGVLSGGNWIIDHVKVIDRFPAQDTLVNMLGQSLGTGGSPYNVLLDLAKLGASFPLEGIGLLGDDEDGQTILADCAAHVIDATRMQVTPEAGTSFTDVMTVQSTGRRTFFHFRGANALLDESHFRLESSRARLFHLGYLLLLDKLDIVDEDGRTGASRLLEKARQRGFLTSVDVVSEHSDRFVAVVRPVLPHVDILILNEFEAGASTGMTLLDGDAVDPDLALEAAGCLLDYGVHQWVIIHYPAGAVARHRDGRTARQGRVEVSSEEIRSTVGAGDAFASGLLFGLHEGWDMPRCLRLAACTAASNLYGATCTDSVRSVDACLALGEKLGYRATG